jgi:hypothetical protein
MCDLPVSIVILKSGGSDAFQLSKQLGRQSFGTPIGNLLWRPLNLRWKRMDERNQEECEQHATARVRHGIHWFS